MYAGAIAKRRIVLVVLSGLFVILHSTAFSQTHGQITGSVTDKRTKMPLSYANVMLLGTSKGAMTMDDGTFNIAGVPPGNYKVKVSMMGFKSVERDVVVAPGRATTLDFGLVETIVGTIPVIDVWAKRPLVDVTSVQKTHTATDEDLKRLPFDNIKEVHTTDGGVVMMGSDFHVHGGRAGEVVTQIDGVPVNDPLTGSEVTVGYMAADASELISGAMDAEYGNAQSGVFNITTKEGGKVFAGEFRYMTDDFGRADKTYTNYDNLSIGFGGPTPVKHLRYYVSGEGTFSDGENVSIEPRTEHRNNWLDFIKARDRMNHSINLQTKLSWHANKSKVTGEVIYQASRNEEYRHNWNVEGYVQKVYYFQRLIDDQTGRDIFTFGGISSQYEGPWIRDALDPTKPPYPRPVTVEQIIVDPETGGRRVITHTKFRAVDIDNNVTILWDEEVGTGNYRPWILFEGYQFPESDFSPQQLDSSYVFFNSASRTPEVKTNNLHLKLGLNHNITDNLLYSVRLSRLAFNRTRSVAGKAPHQYDTAGLPVTLPNGVHLQGGITQATWFTDENNPYIVTAYDFPFYGDQHSIQYLLKTDLTSLQVKGHRMRIGVQALYNDLDNEDRAFPGQVRFDPIGGNQQGLLTNVYHSYNNEGAIYAQDKWEYEGMVINAGVRLDFLSTGNNDDIDVNSAQVSRDVDKYKTNWSPRLGVAFPITDRDKFFFHYGRFTQWPRRSEMFASQDAVTNLNTLGNPNLGPELTVSYAAGIAHQFTENMVGEFAVFYKDIYGLVSSTWVVDDSTGLRDVRHINKTYASYRGLEVSLDQRLTRYVGFSADYTYSFADGVASDSDFGRSADGLTHLPTDELPLDWDQRQTFSAKLFLRNRNNWTASLVYQYGSGLPWTPVDRAARLRDPTLENSERHPAIHRLSMLGKKNFNIYGRQLALFFEGRNLLDQDILRPGGEAPGAAPGMVVAQMDGGSYLTETGRYGGAYLVDTDGDGRDNFVPVHDPTVWEQHRTWRIGLGFEF